MSLALNQSSNGYRYSIDSFLLAGFCCTSADAKILDLGSGCGVVSILLSKIYPKAHIVGIEIQDDLIRMANRNLYHNKLIKNIRFIHGNIKEISRFFEKEKEEFDVVITNPPYYKIGNGRINPHNEKASAKHEIVGSIKDFINAGVKVLRPKGSFYIIFTATRLPELINELKRFRLEPKILKNVHAKKDSNANLVLLKATKMGKPGLKIVPPIYIFKRNGEYSTEAQGILKKWDF